LSEVAREVAPRAGLRIDAFQSPDRPITRFSMDLLSLFGRFAAALAVGLLAGMQREFQHRSEGGGSSIYAGVRTFSLAALAGATGAFLGIRLQSGLVVAAVVVAVGMLALGAYRAAARRGDAGLTTEVALVATTLVGALCVAGPLALAAAVGVAMTILLALKPATRRLVGALTEEDVEAALKFAAVSVLILPVLPDRPVGPPPFDALSPFKVWLMVVFISALSFLGYVLVKIADARRGIGLMGVLGGLASSTAVTLSFTDRSKREDGLSVALAAGVVAAWTVMFGRVLVEMGVVNPRLLAVAWPGIAAGGVAGVVCAVFLYWRSAHRSEEPDGRRLTNPFELRSALTFGALYAVVLVVARAAQMYLGPAGVYASAIASGLADVDAITLSMAELSARGGLELGTASRAVALAVASNTVVKGGMVLVLGSRAMARAVAPVLVAILVALLGVAFLL
jgi:uncharacterized membrane protein (DUF4010 family)